MHIADKDRIDIDGDQKLLFMSKEVHEEFKMVFRFLLVSLKRLALRLFFSA